MAFGIIIPAGFKEEVSAATEIAITDIPWDEVEKVIKEKMGQGYNEVGLCTGFVYWCLKNAYGVDWGDNSTVSGLEDKLKDKDISLVASGKQGEVTSNMKPGDIVIFLEAGGGSHCAILGEGGKLYHATTSSGVTYSPTLSEWMSYPPEDKNCDEYRIYRGISSTGEAKLVKSSAAAAITNDNDCYSVKGTEYGVYDNKACTSKVGTFTVKADGTSNVLELNVDTYYVKETKAPKGFKLDDTVYTMKVEAGKVKTVKAEDTPKATTTLINLYKSDEETEKESPQGGAELSGTQFIWKYYDGYYTKANLPATPTRTWVTQTKAETSDGKTSYVTRLESGFKVSGDSLYTLDGKPCIPLGTLTVEEMAPPKGYKLDSATYIKEKGTDKETKGLYVTQIREDGEIAELQGGSRFFIFDDIIRGGVKIQKRDNETGDAKAQGAATLEGTEFTITNMNENPVLVEGKFYEKGQVVKTMTTGKDGSATTSADLLPYGTYRITETGEPKGYLPEGVTSVDFSITEDGKIVAMTGAEKALRNDVIRGGIKIQKRDSETEKKIPQGDATLSGAAFTIITLNDGPVLVDGKLYTKGQQVKTITTNDEGVASTAADTLPYGKYRIEETKSPVGYLLEGTLMREFTIEEDGKILEYMQTEQSILNDVIRGGVKIQKRDLETGKAKAQGGASLKDTEFTITSLSKGEVLVNGKLYAPGEIVVTIKSDIDGIAQTSADLLPYGTYEIEEVTPPEGYLLKGTKKHTFEIREDGKVIDLTTEDTSVYNQVKRGDLEGVKIGEGTHKRLSDVPFKITSLSTGESHIIVTDSNGQFSTSSDWASHKHNTNEGKTSEDGIWFGEIEPDDAKGALIYDTYEIEELRCESNKGMKLIPAFTVKVYRNNQTIHLGTLTDEYDEEITIKTMALNKDTEDKYISPTEGVTIVDTITMTGLTKGTEYLVKGWQMVKEDEEALYANGVPVANEMTFIAEKSDMEVQMEFTFDASGLSGKSLVAFEELYEILEGGDSIKVAEHTDISDEGQTVIVAGTPEPRDGGEPEEPTEPEPTEPEPTDPTEPTPTEPEPQQPTQPQEPEKPADPVKPTQPEKKADSGPATGDDFPVVPFIIAMAAAAVIGTSAVFIKKKRAKRW